MILKYNTHINPLILNTIYLPTYHISLYTIYKSFYTHIILIKYGIIHTFMAIQTKIIEFKNNQYQQLDYQYPGILFAEI